MTALGTPSHARTADKGWNLLPDYASLVVAAVVGRIAAAEQPATGPLLVGAAALLATCAVRNRRRPLLSGVLLGAACGLTSGVLMTAAQARYDGFAADAARWSLAAIAVAGVTVQRVVLGVALPGEQRAA